MKTKTTIISLVVTAVVLSVVFLVAKRTAPVTENSIQVENKDTPSAIQPAIEEPEEVKPLICTPPPAPHPAQKEIVLSIVEDVVSIVAEEEVSIAQCEVYIAPSASYYEPEMNRNEYNHQTENKFKAVTNEPLSTFSIDVDAASYGTLRRYINQGQTPPEDAVRVEELINYFSYNYGKPAGNDPVKLSTEVGPCPWNKENRLVRIREALDELTAGGSTAGGEGIQLAYQIARRNYISEGNNRVILCTDGDFNVGVSSSEGLERLTDNSSNQISPDFRFASAVAMFGQLLRNSEYKGTGSYNQVISLARSGLVNDQQGYKREFIRMVEAINGLKPL